MTLDNLRILLRDVFAHRRTRCALITVYVIVILVLLAPVLLSPIGADDSYWVLDKGPISHGSLWTAFWQPISVVFDFDFQPRTTALAFSERRVLALLTMKAAVYFSIPPFIVWGAVKLALLALGIVVVRVFLRQLRFRDSTGAVRLIGRESVAFITIALPAAVVIGAKSQNISGLNGWNFYPTLSYGPFVFFLLFAALVLRLSRLLQANYRRWAVPVLLLMMVMGLVVNLSYELLALCIPLNLMLLVLAPRPTEGTLWHRWRAPLTVVASLAVTYTAIFVWIRWQISQMACHATDTCYAGTVLEVRPRTLWNNLVGSFPGGTSDFVREDAVGRGLAYPGVSPISIVLAALAVTLMLAIWMSWRSGARTNVPADEPSGRDTRGLVLVVLVGLAIALGSTVITGANANAVEQLRTSMLSYRSNVVTWSALALAGVAAVRLLVISRWVLLRVVGIVGLSGLILATIALNQPRNAFSVRTDRTGSRIVFFEGIQREVALGDRSRVGDARRCAILTAHLDRLRGEIDPRTQRTINGAYAAFEFYHHETFCSTGAGDPQAVS